MTPSPPIYDASTPEPGEIQLYFQLALNPFGNPADLAERERATRWLLEHATAAYPVVASEAASSNAPACLELLARFDRPESTPIFAKALHSAGFAAAEAGLALAAASDDAAARVLSEAVRADDVRIVIAALDGLRVRNEASLCEHVLPSVESGDARVRYAAVHAAGALGCIDRARLKAIGKADPDADVRSLAARLARRR
jgi:hypothetical protein